MHWFDIGVIPHEHVELQDINFILFDPNFGRNSDFDLQHQGGFGDYDTSPFEPSNQSAVSLLDFTWESA